MPGRKLPPADSEEFIQAVEIYQSGTREQIEGEAAKWDMTPGNFRDRMVRMGYRRKPPPKPKLPKVPTREEVLKVEDFFFEQLKGKIQAIPEVSTWQPKMGRRKGTPETQVALFSDCQCGIKTATYNSEVFRTRLREYTEKLIRIATLQRYSGPLHDLVILCLGDEIHGERVGRQVNLDELECPAHSQILDIFAPAFYEMLLTLYQHYNRIYVYSVEGNHGWPGGQESAYGSNWDTIAIELAKAKLGRYKRLEIQHERLLFYKLVEIQRHYFLMVHGDQIPIHLTVPYYGVTTRGLRWKGSIDVDMDFATAVMDAYKKDNMTLDEAVKRMISLPFEAVCIGHFHTASFLTFNDVLTFMNGCFPSSDLYPLKKMGLGSKPCQWTFGVHPQQCPSFMYPLFLR